MPAAFISINNESFRWTLSEAQQFIVHKSFWGIFTEFVRKYKINFEKEEAKMLINKFSLSGPLLPNIPPCVAISVPFSYLPTQDQARRISWPGQRISLDIPLNIYQNKYLSFSSSSSLIISHSGCVQNNLLMLFMLPLRFPETWKKTKNCGTKYQF